MFATSCGVLGASGLAEDTSAEWAVNALAELVGAALAESTGAASTVLTGCMTGGDVSVGEEVQVCVEAVAAVASAVIRSG